MKCREEIESGIQFENKVMTQQVEVQYFLIIELKVALQIIIQHHANQNPDSLLGLAFSM